MRIFSKKKNERYVNESNLIIQLQTQEKKKKLINFQNKFWAGGFRKKIFKRKITSCKKEEFLKILFCNPFFSSLLLP